MQLGQLSNPFNRNQAASLQLIVLDTGRNYIDPALLFHESVYFLHDAIGSGSVMANHGHTQLSTLPQVLAANLTHTDIEPVAQTLNQAFDHLAFGLERVCGGDMQFNYTNCHSHRVHSPSDQIYLRISWLM
jgi:hypothetical protein